MVKSVNICDVGLRDGIQSIAQFIPTKIKISLIKHLIACGIKEMEITSFVHPKAIPQFSDAEVVVKEVGKDDGITFKALIPNLKGAERALKAGVSSMVFVLSASEIHNMSNVKMTTSQSLEQLKAVIEFLKTNKNIELQLDLATTFGYHLETVTLDTIDNLTREILKLNVNKIVYCDTSGLANPHQVENLISRVRNEYPSLNFGFHFHDTYGSALSNCLKAIECDTSDLETSIAGMGGCPFAVNASGNLATEDLVWNIERLGVSTGIDMDRLIEAVGFVKENILNNTQVCSRVYNAIKGRC